MARIANPLEELSLEDLRHRTSVKWRTYPQDVLPLWVAEMDVRLAEPIAAALTRAIERGDTGYPAGRGLAEAYAGFAARRWGWKGVDPANTALVPDVMLGIVEVIRLLTSPGDSVIVSAPVYPPFFAFVEHDQRHIRQAPCDDAGRLDLTALDRAFGEARADGRAAVYLMSNPHNPTGVVHSRTELEQVAALARHHGVRVISDEIHSPLALPGADVVPFLSVAGAEDSFAVVSASKAWNLAGLKTGLVVAGPGAAADLRRLPEEVGHGASHLGVIAHTTAFEEGEPWLDALLAGLADNRTLVGELVGARHPWIGLRPPEGTYLAWLDCRPLGLHDAAVDGAPGVVTELAGPARFFLDHARVALSSGHVFGSGGAGHVRLNFATSRTILTEALDRMSRALEASGPVPRRDR